MVFYYDNHNNVKNKQIFGRGSNVNLRDFHTYISTDALQKNLRYSSETPTSYQN
jgi:hypothetical protein